MTSAIDLEKAAQSLCVARAVDDKAFARRSPRIFHTIADFGNRNLMGIVAALAWYIQPWTTSGRRSRSNFTSRQNPAIEGLPGRRPKQYTGTPTARMRSPIVPSEDIETTELAKRGESIRLRSL
jgi:hypothetical protein